MAFKDLFKPKWKNSNPQIREEAIKKINDKILLERIAKSDQEYRIRQIAYTKLGQGSSSMSLADIAKHDQSLDTRIEAIEKINDSKILFNLSSYDNSSDNLEYFQKLRIRGAATRKINDQQMLVDIAYNSNNSDIRKIAVRKINDQEVLVNIAKHDKDKDVRREALKKIEDQNVLAELGIYIRNDVWDVFGDNKFYCLDVSSLFVIVSQITKHENLTPHAKKALVEIAMKIENPITNLNTQYRELAIDYIEDQNILEYIAQDIDDNVLVRSHAIRKLKDQEVLVNIYLNDRSLLLRKKAIYGITDLNFLTKILKEVRIEFEIREAAKLRREKLLVNRILQKDEMIPKNSKQTKNEIENVKTKTSDKTFENDNDTFKSVIIGNQEWLVDNLNVGRFKNGDPLKIANNTEEWILAGKLREPAFCYYDFNPANGDSFGKLYNWFAVNDIRGLAPEGWSIPSNDDWIQLANCLGGEENAGGRLKGDIYWTKKDAKNIMDTGFQGLPGGICFWGSETKFDYIGQHGYWWTSTEYDTSYAISRSIFFFSPELFIYNDLGKESGMSVRCIKKI